MGVLVARRSPRPTPHSMLQFRLTARRWTLPHVNAPRGPMPHSPGCRLLSRNESGGHGLWPWAVVRTTA